MFGIIPKPLWQRHVTPDSRNRIPLNMRCLLLESSDRLILIDTGLGTKYDETFADRFAVDTSFPTLLQSLDAAGFGPGDVTDVVLTHLHFDHGGGATYRDGDALRLTFPNAQHHVQAAHWTWANDPNPREGGSFFAENLEPLAASGQLVLHDGPGALFPNVEVLLVNGHTEAQQLVKVSDEARTLLYAADLLPTSAHLAPVWGMGYDVRPLVTIDEKARLLQQAREEGWTLFFEHDPHTMVAEVDMGRKYIEPVHPRATFEL